MNRKAHGGGWSWREPRRGSIYRTCSYCGSVNPSDIVNVENLGDEWADWKYGWPHKLYLSLPNPTPDLEYCLASGNTLIAPKDTDSMRFKLVMNLTKEESEICEQDGMGFSGSNLSGYVGFGKRKTLPAKLYSEHLADDDLPEEVKIAIGKKIGRRFEFTDNGGIRWWTPKETIDESH